MVSYISYRIRLQLLPPSAEHPSFYVLLLSCSPSLSVSLCSLLRSHTRQFSIPFSPVFPFQPPQFLRLLLLQPIIFAGFNVHICSTALFLFVSLSLLISYTSKSVCMRLYLALCLSACLPVFSAVHFVLCRVIFHFDIFHLRILPSSRFAVSVIICACHQL